jgi:hypothetical protein
LWAANDLVLNVALQIKAVLLILAVSALAPSRAIRELKYRCLGILQPVFRIRIRMDPHSIGRPDPGGLKRVKMKKKRSKKPDN